MSNGAAVEFPRGFLWGAATAAHQVEGGTTNSDWWEFEHAAGTVARESSIDGIDHYHRHLEDFPLLRSLGHNTHRLSLEWSRIEPAPGEFSQAALAHYRRVLAALADLDLTAFVTMHHFTLPRWFAAQGGWLSRDAVSRFTRYVRRTVDELGDQCRLCAPLTSPRWSFFMDTCIERRPGTRGISRDFARQPKPSAHAFATLATTGSLDALRQWMAEGAAVHQTTLTAAASS